MNNRRKTSLNELKAQYDIIINNADKGGAVVIQDIQDYIWETEQLNTTEKYRERILKNYTKK